MARTLQAAGATVVSDPPIRPSGRCVVCNKTRPEVAAKHGDPYCSTECAKRWYGLLTKGGG